MERVGREVCFRLIFGPLLPFLNLQILFTALAFRYFAMRHLVLQVCASSRSAKNDLAHV